MVVWILRVWFVEFGMLTMSHYIQVALEVEQEEDEGGTAGETFTDYVSVMVDAFSLKMDLSGLHEELCKS